MKLLIYKINENVKILYVVKLRLYKVTSLNARVAAHQSKKLLFTIFKSTASSLADQPTPMEPHGLYYTSTYIYILTISIGTNNFQRNENVSKKSFQTKGFKNRIESLFAARLGVAYKNLMAYTSERIIPARHRVSSPPGTSGIFFPVLPQWSQRHSK